MLAGFRGIVQAVPTPPAFGGSMQTGMLVTIIFRIVALKGVVDSLFLLLYQPIHIGQMVPGGRFFAFAPLVGFLGMLAACRLLWVYSESLSKRVCGGAESRISLVSLTVEDLYSLSMVFIGIWFSAAAIPSLLIRTYHCLARDPTSSVSFDRLLAFYNLTQPILQGVIGFGLIIGARKWSARLAAFNSKHGNPPNHVLERTAR